MEILFFFAQGELLDQPAQRARGQRGGGDRVRRDHPPHVLVYNEQSFKKLSLFQKLAIKHFPGLTAG